MSETTIERVREQAESTAELDDELNFYDAAIELGIAPDDAERIDAQLTIRVMQSRGAI